MNFLAGGFNAFFDVVFANWQMILYVLLTILLLLTILFRHFKLSIAVFIVSAFIVAGVLLVDLIFEAIHWDIPTLVDVLVRWAPTILFTVIILLTTLIGSLRGLRKSLILLLHEVIIGIVCITVFFVCVNLPAVDEFMLNLVDWFMGGSGALQDAVGVTQPCTGLKEVFVIWLPQLLKDTGISVMLQESSAYIYTLADMCYHIAFAVILIVVDLILDFILYIIYHCCYSERKYKKKIQQKYAENKVDRRYLKHPVGGAVVGVGRGLAIGLLSMAFLGTALYSVAGLGEGKLKDVETDNENVNFGYTLYRSIESYGTYGIFKVLNSMTDADDMPYYLFAADLVFSGELNDENLGVSDHIVFREELGAYTGFARDTLMLLMHYGEEELVTLINSNASTNEIIDAAVKVMAQEGFRAEFKDLINGFDMQTYIINFAMSFVNSTIAHIDDTQFANSISEDNKQLLKLLFTRGYLCEVIPDEKEMIDLGISGNAFARPYINISKLATKDDVNTVFEIVLDLLSNQKAESTRKLDELGIIKKILPNIRNLSLLDENREAEFDPVLCRLYTYAANKYLTTTNSDGLKFTDLYEENISWVNEINNLLDVSEAALHLYENIYSPDVQPLDMLNQLFDADDPKYAENNEYYDAVCDRLIKSKLIGKVLTTSYVYNFIKSGLNSVFAGIYIPEGLVYESTFDDNGNLIKAGELFNLLSGVSQLGRSGLIEQALQIQSATTQDRINLLDDMAKCLGERDAYGNTLADYSQRSVILRSLMSVALVNYASDFVYVPKAACETDGNGEAVNLIKPQEIEILFKHIEDLIDFVRPLVSDAEADLTQSMLEFMEKDAFGDLLQNSTIFEGTIAQRLVDALKSSDIIVVSKALSENFEGWVTVDGKDGELKALFNALSKLGIDVADVLNGEIDAKSVLNSFVELTANDVDDCLQSSVLHYTISNYVANAEIESFKVIVPYAARQMLRDDTIDYVIRAAEIKHLIRLVKGCNLLGDNASISRVFAGVVDNIDVLSDGYMVTASLIYSLLNNEDFNVVSIPDDYSEAAAEEKLLEYNNSNIWKAEIANLVKALDEILGVSRTLDAATADGLEGEERYVAFDITTIDFNEQISSLVNDLEGASYISAETTKLRVCMASKVVAHSISEKLDEYLTDAGIERKYMDASKDNRLNYKVEELEALNRAKSIFGIEELNNINKDELIASVQEKVLQLNDEYSDGKTILQVIYPSHIIMGMLSDELENILLDKNSSPSQPLINSQILALIRNNSMRYTQSEIRNLVNAIKAFGVDDFDSINTLDANSLKGMDEGNVDIICLSDIMRGVLTKQIYDNLCVYTTESGKKETVDHALAYEKDVRLYRIEEIKCLWELFNEIAEDDLSQISFNDLTVTKLKQFVYNAENGAPTRSYLVLANISFAIVNNSNLIVDYNLLDSYNHVKESEIYWLLNSFELMFGVNSNMEHLKEIGGNFAFPTENRNKIFRSEIIRAKITDQIISVNQKIIKDKENAGQSTAGLVKYLYVENVNVTEITAIGGTSHIVLSEKEMCALCESLEVLNGDETEKFRIPSFNSLQDIADNIKDIPILYKSDIMKYMISDCFIKATGYSGEREDGIFSAVSIVDNKIVATTQLTYVSYEVIRDMFAD